MKGEGRHNIYFQPKNVHIKVVSGTHRSKRLKSCQNLNVSRTELMHNGFAQNFLSLEVRSEEYSSVWPEESMGYCSENFLKNPGNFLAEDFCWRKVHLSWRSPGGRQIMSTSFPYLFIFRSGISPESLFCSTEPH